MTRRFLVCAPDLFFATKIAATAEAAGVAVEMLAPAALLERCRAAVAEAADASTGAFGASPAEHAASHAALVILDLAAGPVALDAARALKAEPATREVPIVGFHSHVDTATREAALAAGIDHVLPRSAFVAWLPDLMRGAAPASSG